VTTQSPPEQPSPAESARPRPGRFALRSLAALHRLAEKGWATSAVGFWAFLQASVIPGPVDGVIVPLGVADPGRAFRFAWAATIGSVLGVSVAWAIGVFAFDSLGLAMLGLVGLDAGDVDAMRSRFQGQGWWVVLVATVTPLSLKLTTLAAGAIGVPLYQVALAVLAGRGFRFMIVAAVVHYAGDRVERWIERRYGKTLHELATERKAELQRLRKK
jgi:membrane protein YqaA with SNARE-associated domain